MSVLRTDLRFCKRKATDQAKQITELQNMLAEQQKQTLEYANRLDENDKKSEEMSSKISTLLQELNKCKIELHYYRSKSPATPICNNCGQTTLTIPPGNLLALMKHNINSSREEIINVIGKCSNSELVSKVQSHESCISQDLITTLATPSMTPTSTPNKSSQATPNAMMALNNMDNDNKDALNAFIASNLSSLLSMPTESIDSIIGIATPGSSDMASPSTPINRNQSSIDRNGILDRLKLVRNKVQQFTEWRHTAYDKASVIENAPNSLMTEASAIDVAQSSISTLIATDASTEATATAAVLSGEQQSTKKPANSSSVILTVGTPRFYGKRKIDDSMTSVSSSNDAVILNMPNTSTNNDNISVSINNSTANSITNKTNATATNNSNLANSNLSDNYNKKARRVQNKLKIQTNNMNIKTRNK